jgi:LPXTG-motif cell wall-anchored protein
MSKAIVQTHAGDDSDGRIWGIEGMNILFILAGLLLSVGLALLLVRRHPAAFSVAVGTLPFVLTTAYVFALRQGKPKSYDTDLLETLIAGTGWVASAQQPRSPLHESA